MKILISQQMPSNFAAYEKLQSQFGAELDFRPFFLIEPLSAKEFRAEHISLPDYTAIVFSSRHAIDARIKIARDARSSGAAVARLGVADCGTRRLRARGGGG